MLSIGPPHALCACHSAQRLGERSDASLIIKRGMGGRVGVFGTVVKATAAAAGSRGGPSGPPFAMGMAQPV